MRAARPKTGKTLKIFGIAVVAASVLVGSFMVSKLLPEYQEAQESNKAFAKYRDKVKEKTDSSPSTVETKAEKDEYGLFGDSVQVSQPVMDIPWDDFKGTDIIAWIQMDNISYPVMKSWGQKDDEGQDLYLRHLPDKTYAVSGSIFIYDKNNPLLTDQSTFIYGHNMMSDTMFGSLKHYTSDDFRDHQFCVYLPNGTRHTYQFFSENIVPQSSNLYTWAFASDDSFLSWQNRLQENSLIHSSLSPSKNAHFVTMSTCSGYAGTTKRLMITGMEVRCELTGKKASWYDKYKTKLDKQEQSSRHEVDEHVEAILDSRRKAVEAEAAKRHAKASE